MKHNKVAQIAQGAVEWANNPGAVESFPATARAHINGLASLLLSKLRAPVADETQALHDHDLWFQEYGQTLGAFHNSLTIHTRAAWVAASRQYAALASAPVACDHQFHFFGDQKERRCNRCNALESKASAPVAGEASAALNEWLDKTDFIQKRIACGELPVKYLGWHRADVMRDLIEQPRPSDDALWDQTLTERDEYHDMADKLANAIADHLLVEIGEHSSSNCPWMRALEAIENAAPPPPPGPPCSRGGAAMRCL